MRILYKVLLASCLGVLWVLSVAVAAETSSPMILDRLEASVNSTLVLKSDIGHFKKTERLRAQMDPLYQGTILSKKGNQASDDEITEFLINERLIAQLFPVTDAESEQEVNSIQNNNHIDRETLKAALTQQGFTYEEYFELIRASTSKRSLIDREIRTKVSISDSDIKNYFYNHYAKSSEAGNRSYRLRIIVISARNYKNSSAIKKIAQRAYQAIKKGEAFEAVAKRFSDDASANSGGDLGVLTEEQMSTLVRNQLKGMKVGQVSEMFGSPTTAYYILKLDDILSNEAARLEKMRDEIHNHLLTSEYQHQIQHWLDRQRQNAFIHKAGESSINYLPIQP